MQLIMEFLPLGSLKEYIIGCKIGVPQCLLFAGQICQVSKVWVLGSYPLGDRPPDNESADSVGAGGGGGS